MNQERFVSRVMTVLLVLMAATVAVLAAPVWAQSGGVLVPVVPPATPTAFASFLQSASGGLVDLLLAGAIALGSLVARLVVNYTANMKLGKAVSTVTAYIETATKHLLEGLAPDVKADLQNDGVIDAAERAALLAKGIALVKLELPDWVQSVLGSSLGAGLTTYLSGKVASALDGHLTALVAGPSATNSATETKVAPAASAPRPL